MVVDRASDPQADDAAAVLAVVAAALKKQPILLRIVSTRINRFARAAASSRITAHLQRRRDAAFRLATWYLVRRRAQGHAVWVAELWRHARLQFLSAAYEGRQLASMDRAAVDGHMAAAGGVLPTLGARAVRVLEQLSAPPTAHQMALTGAASQSGSTTPTAGAGNAIQSRLLLAGSFGTSEVNNMSTLPSSSAATPSGRQAAAAAGFSLTDNGAGLHFASRQSVPTVTLRGRQPAARGRGGAKVSKCFHQTRLDLADGGAVFARSALARADPAAPLPAELLRIVSRSGAASRASNADADGDMASFLEGGGSRRRSTISVSDQFGSSHLTSPFDDQEDDEWELPDPDAEDDGEQGNGESFSDRVKRLRRLYPKRAARYGQQYPANGPLRHPRWAPVLLYVYGGGFSARNGTRRHSADARSGQSAVESLAHGARCNRCGPIMEMLFADYTRWERAAILPVTPSVAAASSQSAAATGGLRGGGPGMTIPDPPVSVVESDEPVAPVITPDDLDMRAQLRLAEYFFILCAPCRDVAHSALYATAGP
jgi:hypothetical protein